MKTVRIVPLLLLFALVFSCKPQVPDEYIQPDEFEDILYDFHHTMLHFTARPYFINMA